MGFLGTRGSLSPWNLVCPPGNECGWKRGASRPGQNFGDPGTIGWWDYKNEEDPGRRPQDCNKTQTAVTWEPRSEKIHRDSRQGWGLLEDAGRQQVTGRGSERPGHPVSGLRQAPLPEEEAPESRTCFAQHRADSRVATHRPAPALWKEPFVTSVGRKHLHPGRNTIRFPLEQTDSGSRLVPTRSPQGAMKERGGRGGQTRAWGIRLARQAPESLARGGLPAAKPASLGNSPLLSVGLSS